MPFGAELTGAGEVRFRLWAPAQPRIELALTDPQRLLPMQREEGGWHCLVTAAAVGARYWYRLDDGRLVPDPASRFQPAGLDGPSEIVDPLAHRWRDRAWKGLSWHQSVLYELHIGTFTPEGTFAAAAARLDHLAALGVNTIELMPIAAFPGSRGWGYDAALPFAPHASYGPPEALKQLIDAAHASGIAVVLDVVYNHFGPEGNYLALYAPQFFNPLHHTPWGAGVNFDGPGSGTVRDYFVHNALYWLEEYHFDGLRLDAVHAIADGSEPHILEQIARAVREHAWPRAVHLLLENQNNEPRWLLRSDGSAAPRLYDAQWNDGVHHGLHVAATGEGDGYYAEFHDDSSLLGSALACGFTARGESRTYRGGGCAAPGSRLPPTAFVAFLQNHDQIGNRAFGERLTTLATPEALRAISALQLLLPELPMLFMGEEWGCTQPFLFFCHFGDELADKVREGRRAEFAHFPAFRAESARSRIPDPQEPSTFLASKLDWGALAEPAYAQHLRRYAALLAVRRRHIEPLLPRLTSGGEWRVLAPGAVSVRWRSTDGRELYLAANLRAEPTAGFPHTCGRLLWQQGRRLAGDALAGWSVRWMLRT